MRTAVVGVFLLLSHLTLTAQDTLSNPSACALNLVLNDETCPDDRPFFAPNRFPISVDNAPGTQLGTDVYLQQVKLLIRHDWVSDLDIVLEAPSGRRMTLTSDNGGGESNYGDAGLPNCEGAVVFDAAACTSITADNAAAPFTDGPYQPEESLLALNDSLTNPNDTWYLEICDDFAADSGYLDFVELVFAPLNCLPVTSVEVVNIDTTTVVLDWGPSAGCGGTTTIIEYGPPGFIPGTDTQPGQGTVVTTTCPPFALTGLAPETGYDIYLRKSCDGVFSGNSCGTTVITGCQPPPVSVRESFDAEADCAGICGTQCTLSGIWFNPDDNPLDWQVRSGPTPTQNTGPDADVDGGGKYVYLETTGSSCPAGSQARLRSGCFLAEASPTGACNISFNYHMFGPDVGQLQLAVSKDGGQSWQTIWSKQGPQSPSWIKQYVTYSTYQVGDQLQFRFTATRGSGSQGDIALDNITIYGLTYQGRPQNTFYADADGDGYGDPATTLQSCSAIPPAGYVLDDTDCDDTRADVNPEMEEIPCDNIDNNCNGIEDDVILPPPLVINDTICDGQQAFLRAQPVSGKSIFWYTQPDDLFEIPEFGVFFTPDLPPNNTSFPQEYRFYAEETDFLCFSDPKAEAIVVVNPTPRPRFDETVVLCPDEAIDLAGLNIQDELLTGAELTFFRSPTYDSAARLNDTRVFPQGDTTFYFQFTTDQGCTARGEIPVEVTAGPQITPLPAATFTLCEESAQELAIVPADTADAYQFSWSTGAITPTLTVEATGAAGTQTNYSVTVTDALGCRRDTTFQVETISSIASIIRSTTEVSDCAGDDGAITLTPQGGLPPFTYEWAATNGDTGRVSGITNATYTINGLSQGAYRITITDNSSEACAFRLRTTYVNGPDAEVTDVNVTPVSCAGAADGGICLEVIGNPAYRWNTGDTSPCLENISGGYYSVTITEGSCETVVDSVFVPEPLPLRTEETISSPACAATPDGDISVTPFGGTPPYTINWSDGHNDFSHTSLLAGDYSYTMTDARGCMLTDSIFLSAPPPIALMVDSTRNISCTGSADGYLQVSATGGTPPFNYNWSTGSNRPIASPLDQGFYTVTVTDFNGCSRTESYPISEPAPLRVTTTDTRNPVCVGDSSGRIALAANGGRAPYTYQWSDGSTQAVREQLPIGQYTVIVTDASGCQSDTLSYTLTAVSLLDLDVSIQRPLCDGRSDGRVTLTPNGQGPFTYDWERGDQTAVLTEVAPGNYPVRITDGNGCITDTTVTVNRVAEPIQPVFSLVQPQCAGATDGRISTTISGTPSQPLQYTWSDGPFTSDRERIGEGSYQVTITDALGCRVVSDTLRIKSPDPVQINLAGQGDILCQGDTTGFLELNVQGGIPPYSYTWTGSTDTTNAIYNLGAGQYRVFVTDANGCPAQQAYILEDPTLLSVEANVEQGNICIGDSTNSIQVQVDGGMAPYAFSWNTGAQTNALFDIVPGDYSVTITDANGCVEQIPAIKLREQAEALQLLSFETTDISCFGARDGEIVARISGGTAPYRYLFSNAELIRTEADSVRVTGLAANDDYSVTVIDANGCVIESAARPLDEPPPLNVRRDSVIPNACFGEAGGSAFITASGGTLPYRYRWLDQAGTTVATTSDLIGAAAGQYTLIVSDQRNCTDTLFTAQITEANSPIELLDTTLLPVRCKSEATGGIRPQFSGGVMPYQYRWSSGATTQNLGNVPAGTYTLTLTDAANCQNVIRDLKVPEPATSITIRDSLRNPSCFGESDGYIDVDIAGGAPPYSLTWLNGATPIAFDTNRVDQLSAGFYDLRVLDDNQCQRTFGYQLLAPDSLTIAFDLLPPAPDSTNGQIRATIQGGTSPYHYVWSTGDTTEMVDQLAPGAYSLLVSDRNGCQVSDSIMLTSTRIVAPEIVRHIRLFPNPAFDQLWMDIQLHNARPVTCLLYRSDGQLMRREDLGSWHSGTYRLDISGYPAGLYRVVLVTEGHLLFTDNLSKLR